MDELTEVDQFCIALSQE